VNECRPLHGGGRNATAGGGNFSQGAGVAITLPSMQERFAGGFLRTITRPTWNQRTFAVRLFVFSP